MRETARVLRGPHSHTCQPTDKDLLNRYAVVDGVKWKELRERRLTPSQAVRELELSKDTTEVPTRNQAKYQLEKLRKEDSPTGDQIQDMHIGSVCAVRYHQPNANDGITECRRCNGEI